MEDLESRIRQGDVHALGDFLQLRRESLLGFIRHIASDRLLAVVPPDDLLQEVSAACLVSLPTAPLDEYSVESWLQQQCRRKVVDAHRFHFQAERRDQRRRISIQGSDRSMAGDGPSTDGAGDAIEALLVASITSPSAAVSRDIRLHRMTQAVGELPEEQRQVLQWRYRDGMPTREIAERIGKSDGAVRVLLSRSVRRLEESLRDVRPSR